MALWIQNVTEGNRPDDQTHDYTVQINGGPPLATFQHVRDRGAAACLRAAADAIDAETRARAERENGMTGIASVTRTSRQETEA